MGKQRNEQSDHNLTWSLWLESDAALDPLKQAGRGTY